MRRTNLLVALPLVAASLGLGAAVAGPPPAATGRTWFFSFSTAAGVPQTLLVAQNEDVVLWNEHANEWELYLDGSDVGLKWANVNALHVRADGSVILSLKNAVFLVPGLVGGPNGGLVTDSDLIVFVPTSTGESTAGSFHFLFDGSDVGLTTKAEDVDGVFEDELGNLELTLQGVGQVPGVGHVDDEDVLRFVPTGLGSGTSGQFARVFDGSDVNLGKDGEDLDGITRLDDDKLFFSTLGSWKAPGPFGTSKGQNQHVARFKGTFGESTSGLVNKAVEPYGVDGHEQVDALSMRKGWVGPG